MLEHKEWHVWLWEDHVVMLVEELHQLDCSFLDRPAFQWAAQFESTVVLWRKL